MERREVCACDSICGRRPAWFLGSTRLQQHRRSVDRGQVFVVAAGANEKTTGLRGNETKVLVVARVSRAIILVRLQRHGCRYRVGRGWRRPQVLNCNCGPNLTHSTNRRDYHALVLRAFPGGCPDLAWLVTVIS